MEKLLQWGIANSNPDELKSQISVEGSKNLDPGVIDAILGKDEAVLMKEAMDVILNEEATLENRETAFDNLEMLVEHIENAKNLKPLKLWQPLIKLLSHKEPSLRRYSAWVIGTATQNNPDAQEEFINNEGFEAVFKALENESNTANLTKLLYCLSCATRHHDNSLNKFQTLNGFQVLEKLLFQPDTDPKVFGRIIFMLNSLVVDQSVIITPLLNTNILKQAFKYLLPGSKFYEDEDVMTKLIQFLNVTLPHFHYIEPLEYSSILAKEISTLTKKFPDELSTEEWNELETTLKS